MQGSCLRQERHLSSYKICYSVAKSQEETLESWLWIEFDKSSFWHFSKNPLFLQDKKYLIINAADSPKQDLMQYVSQSNDFIHAARLRGGHVLVHWWVFQWSTLDLHTQRIPTLMFPPISTTSAYILLIIFPVSHHYLALIQSERVHNTEAQKSESESR